MIATAAIQEDVDVVGLSILSGAHMTLFPRVLDLLKAEGREDILITGGGILPKEDMEALQALGHRFEGEPYLAAFEAKQRLLEGFRQRPLTGTGAGTFELAWKRVRPDSAQVICFGESCCSLSSRCGACGWRGT